MKNPEWLKPGGYGAAIGAVALVIVGFSWGGWVTESTAETLASDRAQQEVIAALLPIAWHNPQPIRRTAPGFPR